jgi:hypothetical protein
MTSRSERIFGRKLKEFMLSQHKKAQKENALTGALRVGMEDFPKFFDLLDNGPLPEGTAEEQFVADLKAELPGFFGKCQQTYEKIMAEERGV